MAVEKALYEAPVGLDAAEEALEIEIVDPESVTISTGDTEIVIEPGKDEDEFGANLAEELDDDILAGISDALLEAYDTDLGSRADW